MLRILIVAILALPVVAAPVPKDFKPKQTDQRQIVGRWARFPSNGNEYWEFFADGTAALSNQGPNAPPIYFTIDPKGTPKTFTWKPTWGSWKGVYELQGDELRIAIVSGNKAVPTEARPGNGYEFYEFRRAPR